MTYGTVDKPNSDIKASNNADLFGGKSVELEQYQIERY